MEKNDVVVIIGAGAGAIGAAYALKDQSKRVIIIDEQACIGGTHINAWVNVHAATPAPPFLEKIVSEMTAQSKISYLDAEYNNIEDCSNLEYRMSLLHQRFVNREKVGDKWQEISIAFNPQDMQEKYMNDLLGSGNVTIKLNTRFKKIQKYTKQSNGNICIEAIVVEDLIKQEEERVEGTVFLDCSGDSVLIRAVEGSELGKDYFLGIDYKDKFGYSTEPCNNNNRDIEIALNCPTLMYRVDENGKEKELPVSKYLDNAQLFEDRLKYVYVNTVSLLWIEGHAALKSKQWVYDYLKNELPRHWNTIKNGSNERFKAWDLKKMRFADIAPILGVRETYRTYCERMLTESDLYNQVSKLNIGEGSNLDKKIAIGNHVVDIHFISRDNEYSGIQNIDINKINANLHPYGVPYGCLVPKRLSNVLVASRGGGFSHIAAGTFRLNKDIMQLGWAAGKAASMFLNHEFIENINDFRYINVDELQKKMGFIQLVEVLEDIM